MPLSPNKCSVGLLLCILNHQFSRYLRNRFQKWLPEGEIALLSKNAKCNSRIRVTQRQSVIDFFNSCLSQSCLKGLNTYVLVCSLVKIVIHFSLKTQQVI